MEEIRSARWACVTLFRRAEYLRGRTSRLTRQYGFTRRKRAILFPADDGKGIYRTTATGKYASGTTELPKGVDVSHHNLIPNLDQTIYMNYLKKPHKAHNRPPERWVGILPLYHAYGQLYTIAMV